jgi:hypothetical protein
MIRLLRYTRAPVVPKAKMTLPSGVTSMERAPKDTSFNKAPVLK